MKCLVQRLVILTHLELRIANLQRLGTEGTDEIILLTQIFGKMRQLG
jgi:hypothetical protein